MDTDSDNLQHVATVLSEKVTDRTFERLARGLESSFPVVRHLTDDAVADAVERTLERARKNTINDPVNYAYVTARNALRRSAKNRAQQSLGEEATSLPIMGGGRIVMGAAPLEGRAIRLLERFPGWCGVVDRDFRLG